MKKWLCMFLFVMTFVFTNDVAVQAELILYEDFEDSSGFTIGGGHATGYWGIAPLSGTASIPSHFVQGGGQSGNIFYGSFGKDFSDLTAAPTMTISLPDLSNYTNLALTVALAAPFDPSGTIMWEISHRDKLEINSDSGTIDLFRPISNASPLRSQTYLIDLGFTFQDFQYALDSSLHSLTFAFASTDYPETIGIDSVRITGDPISSVPEPSTILLLGAGLVGVGLLRRRL